MDKKIKFSIIIPTFNSEKYILNCIKSVLNQNYKNYEIIIVDDFSSDNTINLIKKITLHNKISLTRLHNHFGVSFSRNIGIKKASGDYIMFLDSDDLYLHDKVLSELNRLIINYNIPDILIFSGYTTGIIEGKNEYPNFILNTNNKIYKKNNNPLKILYKQKGTYPFVWQKCFKRKLISNNNIEFNNNVILGEDNIFCFFAFARASSFVFLKEKYYLYRYPNKESSMSKFKNIVEKIECHLLVIKEINTYWANNDLKFSKFYFANWSFEYVAGLLFQIKNSTDLKKCLDKFLVVLKTKGVGLSHLKLKNYLKCIFLILKTKI